MGCREMELTPKQKKFCDEYLIDLNATQAAVRAGYSKKTAAAQGGRLLKNVAVQAAIQEGIQNRAARTGITQDAVLQALAAIGFADVDMNTLKPADKLKALELIGKHLGMFMGKQDTVELEHSKLQEILKAVQHVD